MWHAVRDLGTLTVAPSDEEYEYPIRGKRAAAMLAVLAVNANSRISIDALMDAAWGNDVTAGTMSTLESHIWRLRQMLESDRAPREASTVLINDTGGFRLVAGPVQPGFAVLPGGSGRNQRSAGG